MRAWIAFAALIIIILAINFSSALFISDCPKKTYGTNNATRIKYFSSPLCFACWVQKQNIEKVEAEMGDRFMIEEYDADFCREAAAPQYVRGVPAFIINDTIIYGLQDEKALKEMIG